MKLNFNKPAQGLKGPLDITYGEALAESLYSAKGKDSKEQYKMFDWSMKLVKGEELEVDEADSKTLYEFVEKSSMKNGFIVPILRIIDEAKEK